VVKYNDFKDRDLEDKDSEADDSVETHMKRMLRKRERIVVTSTSGAMDK
jgi:hypothetical protein